MSKTMKDKLQKIIEQYVDYLLPNLTPYEATMYIFLLRSAYIKNDSREVRIGKRTIGAKLGGARGKGGSTQVTAFSHVTELVKGLESKGCIKIGDTNRDGTLYIILLPEEIPLVKEKLSIQQEPEEEDYFNNSEKRLIIFERDNWTCVYCGEKVTSANATLDHLIPQYKGGKNTEENLKTACLICNSIKSGKTYDEAAPFLLKSIQERRSK